MWMDTCADMYAWIPELTTVCMDTCANNYVDGYMCRHMWMGTVMTTVWMDPYADICVDATCADTWLDNTCAGSF